MSEIKRIEGQSLSVLGEYNGIMIQWHHADDAFINATQMCQATGKRWAKYWENQSTQRFVEALANNLKRPNSDLWYSAPGNGGGTWVHRRVAIHLAQWCSPEFAVWVTGQIDNILMGHQVAHREHAEMAWERAVGSLAATIENGFVKQAEHTNRLESKVEVIDERVEDVGNRVAVIESQTHGRRRPFSKWIVEACMYSVGVHWQCDCPVCDVVPVVRKITEVKFSPLPTWEIHHWNGKGGRSSRIAMPMCDGCHKRIEANYFLHTEYSQRFEKFQKLARPVFDSLRRSNKEPAPVSNVAKLFKESHG